MRIVKGWCGVVMLAALLLSCATSEQLTRRSERELIAGQPEHAYQTAIVALKLKSGNPAALAALNASAAVLITERQRRIIALAGADSVIAARGALELRSFRLEVIRHGGTPPQSAGFDEAERSIRVAAAARQYDAGVEAMRAGQPKTAYRRFIEARDFWPGYREVDVRVTASLNAASARLAILPFDQEMDVPGLSEIVRRQVADQIANHLRPDQLTFTEFVSQEELDRRMTVSEQQHMTRERAIALGRRIGASRVVWGRIYGAHTETNTDRYQGNIYRRDEGRDSSGRTVARYVEIPFEAVRRERRVSVNVASEILDVNDESTITHDEASPRAAARTVYTSFLPDVDCARYCLVTPSMRDRDSDQAGHVEHGWHDTFGSWPVPGLLERSRRDHGRRSYRHEYRDEFLANTIEQPVFLDDLPDETDLLVVALDGVWRGVLAQVREQDEK